MLQYLNVVLLSTAAGCGLGYLSFCTRPADYQSTARIVVVSPSEPAAAENGAPPADAARTGGNPVAQAQRELTDVGTLQRALENSMLIALRWPTGGPVSLERIQHSLSVGTEDEPAGVVVLHCHAPSAALPQAILSSVIDAYFVRCAQRSQPSSAQTEQLAEQARQLVLGMQARLKDEAHLRSLVDALGKPADESAALGHLSQQRSALLLRRNHLQQQLTQMQHGMNAAQIEIGSRTQRANPASGASPSGGLAPAALGPAALSPAALSPAALGPAALAPGIGAQERVAELLEADRTLALRYGPEHPKRKAVRLEIRLLARYPAEQAQLLAEQWALLQQFGPSHQRVKVIQQRLDELGVPPLATSGDLPSEDSHPAPGALSELDGNSIVGAADADPQAQFKALQAALRNIDAQDREITQKVEDAIQAREVVAELRQVLQSLPAQANLQTISAALDRLEQLNAAQTALRPRLAMRPALGVRSYAGLGRKLLSSAAAGAAIGVVLALVIRWARGAKASPT